MPMQRILMMLVLVVAYLAAGCGEIESDEEGIISDSLSGANDNPVDLTATSVKNAEMGINTSSTGRHVDPMVATSSGGRSVVVWSAGTGNVGDWEVYARIFGVGGSPVGGDFAVNSNTAGDQVTPAVALDEDGKFTAVWASNQTGDSDIYMRRFTATGGQLGADNVVNTYSSSDQTAPAIEMADNGAYLVIWVSAGQDGSGLGIYGQRFSASGEMLGDEFRVNSTTTGDQIDPAIAMNSTGDTVVVWQSLGQDGNIFGRLYDGDGVAQGSEFRINPTGGGTPAHPHVAMAENGTFVVAWDESATGETTRAFAQRFTAAGAAIGNKLAVNTFTYADVAVESVACDESGDFVVTWRMEGTTDGEQPAIYGRPFFADGTTLTNEYIINFYVYDDQRHSTVSMSPKGKMFVAWESVQAGGAVTFVKGRFLDACFYDEQCEDNNGCTNQWCNVSFCSYQNNTLPCDDGIWCNGDDSCYLGECLVHAGIRCVDDGLWCNGIEQCDENNDECYSVNDPMTNPRCPDDGQWCNGEESCDEDADICVSEYDEASPRCEQDGEFCNGVEYCNEGADECASTGNPCDDWEECNENTDSCVLPDDDSTDDDSDDDADDDVDDDADDDSDDDSDDDNDDDNDDDADDDDGDDDDDDLIGDDDSDDDGLPGTGSSDDMTGSKPDSGCGC